MLKFSAVGAIILVALLAGCGSSDNDKKVVGPEDYVHFSDYFSMNEAVTNEMAMDGGTARLAPPKADPNAAILTGTPADDKIGLVLTSPVQNSAAVE